MRLSGCAFVGAAALLFAGFEVGAIAAGPAMLPGERLLEGGVRRADMLLVTFRDGHTVRLREGKLSDLGSGALKAADELFAQLDRDGFKWERAYPDISEEKLEALRRNASARLRRPAPDLNLAYRLRVPVGEDTVRMVERLAGLDVIARVEPDFVPAPAPSPPDYTPLQAYRNAAPVGIGASQVNGLPGGRGAGVSIADIEYSWYPGHADYPTLTRLGIPGYDPYDDTNHGAAVMGEIVGRDNGFGITGLAPDATPFVVPAVTFAYGYSIPIAIMRCVTDLPIGSVILLEQQTSGPNYTGSGSSQFGLVPVEWQKSTYDAIVTAVGNGYIVVEAAGNGSQNLDSAVYSTGNGGHWPFLPENDSGAIIVGAGAVVSNPRSRLSFSCYGATVDLQGFGESVCTTGYGYLYSVEGSDYYYTSSFGGTSSASPIVASACVLLRSYAMENFGALLTPTQVRSLLISTGTAQAAPSQHIGPLPNVAAAIATMESTAPGPFGLLAPASGETNVELLPLFNWAEAWLTGEYELIIDDDSDFSSPLAQIGGLLAPPFTPSTFALAPATTYWWKVRATNLIGTTESSPAGGFFTTTDIAEPSPGGFNLVSPFDAATSVPVNPAFYWTAAEFADSYDLIIDDDADFSSPALQVAGIEALNYSTGAQALQPITRYYWKVIARNLFGQTVSAPSVMSFTTGCTDPGSGPGLFGLTAPLDGPNVPTSAPTLSWTPASNALSYQVIVDDSPSLASPVYEAQGITGTSHMLPSGTLTSGVRYYWQVWARNAVCATVSSPAISSFGVVIPHCMGDANRDRTVNFGDITSVLQNWGGSGPEGDADNNGQVNFLDIQIVLSHWQAACPI